MSADGMKRLDDFERFAERILPRQAWDFFNGASEEGVSCDDNRKAFKRLRILPRVLRDVSSLDTGTTVLGHHIPFPVCVGPSAAHSRAHDAAECGTARGVADSGTIYAMSSFATRMLEEVADAAPEGRRFFNIYLVTKRDLLLELVRRAERKGFLALVVTIDSPIAGPTVGPKQELYRQSTARIPYSYCNFMRDEEKDLSYAQKIDYAISLINPSSTWLDVHWLTTVTKLPIILKGVLSGEEAKLAVKAGAAGIIVSNHGGRQLDTTPAPMDVLREVVLAVKGQCEVYLDGGVRTGTDVLKALALGAQAVFIGRPVIYALAYNGAAGVTEMLNILKQEFGVAMSLAGFSRVDEINESVLRHKNNFPARL